MRVKSNRPTRNGGYIHAFAIAAHPHGSPKQMPFIDKSTPTLHAAECIQKWQRQTRRHELCRFAGMLGISAESFAVLGACRAFEHNAWAFPMRDGEGSIVGIRLRNERGDKWSVRDSREGLFYVESVPPDNLAWIVEGPTDAAALLSMGLWPVGRPSCMGGIALMINLFKRLGNTRMVIIADNDPPQKLPNGEAWQPGRSGAFKLINSIALPYKLITPPTAIKDVRQWRAIGCDKKLLVNRAGKQPWRRHGCVYIKASSPSHAIDADVPGVKIAGRSSLI